MGGAHECVVDVPEEENDDQPFRVRLPHPDAVRPRCGNWFRHQDDKSYRIEAEDLPYLKTVVSYLADHAGADEVRIWISGGNLRLEADGYRSAPIDIRDRDD
jgi:hypothetical protein